MKTACCLIALLAAVLTVAAQAPQTLRIDVRLINVVTTVTDAQGRFVSDLTANDFTVYEDDVPQKIAHFTQDRNVPISVGLLLDTSGSMRTKMRTAIEAIDRFIDTIHGDDDIFLMTFSSGITVAQDFTNDRRKLSRALGALRINGGTVLYDGLKRALEKVQTGKHDKKAILVLSDGMDAGSRSATLGELVQLVRGSEALVYGLGTGESSYADPAEHVPFSLPGGGSIGRAPVTPGRRLPVSAVNMEVLKQLSTNSGGQAFLLSSTFVDTGSSDIDKILQQIAEEMRSQYTIAYYPPVPDNGKFHTIKVVTRPEYSARARAGYQLGPGDSDVDK